MGKHILCITIKFQAGDRVANAYRTTLIQYLHANTTPIQYSGMLPNILTFSRV